MKWLKNLESIVNKSNPGICPYCGSKNMDCSFAIVVPEKRLGYGDIWCNECKHAYHISRMEISDTLPTGKEIPKELVY